MAAQLAVGYRHLLGVHMPKQCQKALLYYNPVAEKVVAGAQRVKASQLIEKARLPTADSRSPHVQGAGGSAMQAARRRCTGRRARAWR